MDDWRGVCSGYGTGLRSELVFSWMSGNEPPLRVGRRRRAKQTSEMGTGCSPNRQTRVESTTAQGLGEGNLVRRSERQKRRDGVHVVCEICSLKSSPLTAGRRLRVLQVKRLASTPQAHTFERRFQSTGDSGSPRGVAVGACSCAHYWLSRHDSNQTPALQCSWTPFVQSSCVLTLWH